MLGRTLGIFVGIVLSAVCGTALGVGELGIEPGAIPSPVQVIRPEIKLLEHPVILDVQVEPSLGVDTAMRILCATNTYRGEVSVDRQDARVRLSIVGEIRELSPKKIFVSFDVEAQSEDTAGGKGFAAGGGAILEPGKPKSVLTIGGQSLFLTVRFAEQEGS
jgi:hypothetical protein